MAEVTLADLQQMLAATAAANKATAEAGQVNAQRISEINSALDKLALSQQEIFRTSTRVESPAKCSTLGFSPNVGGAEVGFSSMQPGDSSADQELAYGCDNATSSTDAVVPAKCSTLGLSPNVGGVEAMDLFPQSGIVSTVSPGPVGAPLPSRCNSTTQARTSSPQVRSTLPVADTCKEIQVANVMPFDPGTKLESSVLAWVAIPPDSSELSCKISPCGILINCQQYNRLLADALGSIVAWEVDPKCLYQGMCIFKAIAMNLTKSFDPCEQLIMQWLYSCICCQLNIVNWIGHQQINGATLFSSVHSSLPCGNSLDVSLFCKHEYVDTQLDGKETQLDFRAPMSCIYYKMQLITGRFEIFDANTLQPTLRECEETWCIGLFPSQQNTSSQQEEILEAIRVFSVPNAMLLFDWSAYSWVLGANVVTFTDSDFMAFCGDSCRDLVMLSVNIPWEPAVCNQLTQLQRTWKETFMILLVDQSASPAPSTSEPILAFDVSALVCSSQILFTLVHIHHVLVEKWIRCPSAAWCSQLCRGTAKQWTKLQEVHAIDVQSAMLLYLLMPLQTKHCGWVFLRRILATAQHLFHCNCDLVGYLASSPITMPWDPGAQLSQITADVLPYQPVLHFPSWRYGVFSPGEQLIMPATTQPSTLVNIHKFDHHIPLLPGTVPTDAWSMISLDFVEGLPRSGKYDCILVVIDKFTKYGHFTQLSHPYTALTVAETFIDTIYRLHGLPSVIISDRDPVFTSKVWQELFRLSQQSVARRGNQKLSFKYFGPYEILARIGKMAYKLKLPQGSQVHPVLHVSQLKKVVPSDQVLDSAQFCQFLTDDCFLVQPLEILATREIKRGYGFVKQVQVSWSGMPSSLHSWESEAALRQCFPRAPAWGQAGFQGEGSATTPVIRRHRQRDIRRALGRSKTRPAQDLEIDIVPAS